MTDDFQLKSRRENVLGGFNYDDSAKRIQIGSDEDMPMHPSQTDASTYHNAVEAVACNRYSLQFVSQNTQERFGIFIIKQQSYKYTIYFLTVPFISFAIFFVTKLWISMLIYHVENPVMSTPVIYALGGGYTVIQCTHVLLVSVYSLRLRRFMIEYEDFDEFDDGMCSTPNFFRLLNFLYIRISLIFHMIILLPLSLFVDIQMRRKCVQDSLGVLRFSKYTCYASVIALGSLVVVRSGIFFILFLI